MADIADVVDTLGGPADQMLEHARIPLGIRENPGALVPGRCVWHFAAGISRNGGPRDLLFDMPRRNPWRRAAWVPPLAHATTLGDALRRMCFGWMREIPMVRMGLSVQGSTAWFCRERIPDVRGWDGNEPAEQYTLSYMLAVIRAAAGEDWRPERLVLESPRSGWGAENTEFEDVRKAYSQPLLAVGIPASLLALPISIKPLRDATHGLGEPAGLDIESSLRQVLQAWVGDGLPVQADAAEALGMSERSLRRLLQGEGVSWRSIIQDLKFAHASERLRTGKASVREVSEELGFTDVAHFTRFFRRRTGVPPSRWREHVERGVAFAKRGQ